MTAVSETTAAGTPADGAPAPVSLPRDPVARLTALFDAGTMSLLPPVAADGSGAIAASGLIDGSGAVAYASDPRVQGGAMGTDGCAVIVAAYNEAIARGVPIIGLWHSGGARLREGARSLNAVGSVFAAMSQASGVIPQLSVVLGPAAGGAAYGPALTDVVIMSRDGRVFITGPDVVRSVTGEDVDMARLGGAAPHSRRSGLVHMVAGCDGEALASARQVAELLGRPRGRMSRRVASGNPGALVPSSPRRPYDVRPLIALLLDEPGAELHSRWAPNIVTTLGRLAGLTVGVVANNPLRLDGCLDAAAAEKAARFVRMCDAFGVPLVVLADSPGYLPGCAQEWGGVARRAAKLLYAFAEAAVPRITLIARRAYGSAMVAMNSRGLGATRVLAWPGADIATAGAVPADRGRAESVVDEIIAPAATREAIASVIGRPAASGQRHRNIPL
jgi:acetyl-CoA/propionyl-CoA carboxylase carboxyl transferase subunit